MNLATIEVAKDEAKRLAAEYREQIGERRQAEDADIARAYAALAKGTPLIRLSEALVAGGTVERMGIKRWGSGDEFPVTLPAVAVARADGEFAWCNGIDPDGSVTILGKRTVSKMNRRHRISLPAGTFEGIETDVASEGWGWGGIESALFNSLIPPVPPAFRPSTHLRNYHILFEADWQRAPGPPPGDPALLKHVSGDLYSVLAVWDLTEVEQAVLRGRVLPEA